MKPWVPWLICLGYLIVGFAIGWLTFGVNW